MSIEITEAENIARTIETAHYRLMVPVVGQLTVTVSAALWYALAREVERRHRDEMRVSKHLLTEGNVDGWFEYRGVRFNPRSPRDPDNQRRRDVMFGRKGDDEADLKIIPSVPIPDFVKAGDPVGVIEELIKETTRHDAGRRPVMKPQLPVSRPENMRQVQLADGREIPVDVSIPPPAALEDAFKMESTFAAYAADLRKIGLDTVTRANNLATIYDSEKSKALDRADHLNAECESAALEFERAGERLRQMHEQYMLTTRNAMLTVLEARRLVVDQIPVTVREVPTSENTAADETQQVPERSGDSESA